MSTSPRTLAFVFARGGSKGVPRKNLRHLAGLPLVAHSIRTGLATPGIEAVVVSTDDPEIADVAKRHGALVPFVRPAELSGDTSPEWLAWRHAVNAMEMDDEDIFVSLPATSPLRSTTDVTRCIKRLTVGDADIVVTAKQAARHPSFNMVTVDHNDLAHLLMPLPEALHNRQAAPKAFDMTTVAYVCRAGFIRRASRIFEGRVAMVLIPELRALDIDTEFDLRIAELLYDEAQKDA